MPSPRPTCLPSLTSTTTTRASVRLPREIRNGSFRRQISSFASIDGKLAGTKETKVTKGGSQRPTAKEERDINEILSFTVNPSFSSPWSRTRAHRENYEAKKSKEKDPAIGETFAGRPEEAGQAKTKTTVRGGSKGGESQKEIGCSRSRRCEGP